MQQTFVASGLKTLASTTHAAGSRVHGPGGDVHTATTGKTVFHTTPKSVPLRQDIHHQQQQQQTDTAQLLLSLSGSEFPKQTFHTVSKNVRVHRGVSSSGAVTVEPSRSCPLDSSVVKNKETAAKSEVVDRVPVVTPNGGAKPASVVLPSQLADKGIEQPAVPEKVVEGVKDDLTSHMFIVEEGPCKRGRPFKRQMNLVFQEKVLTDAEMALQKEAEASRKALEMLQQELSTGDETGSGVTQSSECAQQKILPVEQPLSKGQLQQPLNNILTTAPRILPKEPASSTKMVAAKTNIVTQGTSVSAPETGRQNVVYQVAGNAVPAIDSGSNETNIVYQLQEGVIAGQDSSNATNIVYQVADNAVVSEQDSSQNIIYQVADNASPAEGSSNTNIIYQVADSSNAGSGSAMTQYMEVLKEAGLPSDVPILLESSDGSYVTVNEEVLMNIMNGGMIQVGDGSIVGGEGVQFIVQEVQEVTEGQVETAVASAEQLVSAEMNVTDSVQVDDQMQVKEANDNMVESGPPVTETDTRQVQPPTRKSFKEKVAESNGKEKTEGLPSLEEREPMDIELADCQNENVAAVACSVNSVNYEVNQLVMEESGIVANGTPVEIHDRMMPQSAAEPPLHSDEIITGDNYGEEAMEGFAVKESKENIQRTRVLYPVSHTAGFTFQEQACSNEVDNKSLPASEFGIGDGGKVADIPADDGLSVEQALQAMMGEGSDTEMEVCANTDASGTTKVRPVISHRDTKGHSTPNEGSVDAETEDLRLVLSPEDDSIKVEDESQSAGEGSLNDSFTLALSSPDSTGNDKTGLGAESLAKSAEGSQVEMKSVESENDTQTHISQGGTAEIKNSCESTLTSVLKSNDSVGVDILPAEVVGVETSESSKLVEVNVFESGERTVQAVTDETGAVPVKMNNSVSLESNSDAISETESPSATLNAAIRDKTEESLGSNSISAVVKSNGATEDAEVLTPEINLTCPVVENDVVSSNGPSSEVLPETDSTSNIGFCNNVDKITSTEFALAETEATICKHTSNIDFDNKNTENSVNVSTGDVSDAGKSLPVISSIHSKAGIESEETVYKTSSVNKLVDSSRSTASAEADILETGQKIDADSEISAAAVAESFVPDTLQQSVTGNVLHEQGKEAQDIELSKEVTELGLNSGKEMKGKETAEVSDCESGKEKKSDGEGKAECESNDTKDVMVIDNQENKKFTLPNINTDENGVHTSADRGEGAVSSPSKDIPYAVGLLPLKTALEKLQAMPEYHPRKTRSASSGKESSSEVPASRLKRKASSSADSLEKKMKPCDAGGGDGNYDSESTLAMAVEDIDETGDENTLLQTCRAEDSGNTILKSPSPEESAETVTADSKMEPLPSVMELVSDSSDAV